MWKAVFVGAIALTMMGTGFAAASEITGSVPASYGVEAHAAAEVDSRIAQAKAALRLTPAQERHWPRVEAALRDVAVSKIRTAMAGAGGMISQLRTRASEIAVNASSMRRLLAAARPLIDSLDENQKRDARQMARAMGFASLAARFE